MNKLLLTSTLNIATPISTEIKEKFSGCFVVLSRPMIPNNACKVCQSQPGLLTIKTKTLIMSSNVVKPENDGSVVEFL
ncbi:acylaminoacyl-peptidase [Trifolium repens]|nr:acylaminoacyl-peptidase [Trifolium repens]